MKRYSKAKQDYRLTFSGKDDVLGPELSVAITNGGAAYVAAPIITITTGGISGIYLTNGGAGYGAVAPTISIISSDGNGINATATCTLLNGAVNTITIGVAGPGYTSPPYIIFIPQPANVPTINATAIASISSSVGIGASATCTILGGVVNTVTLNTKGKYYYTLPIITVGAGGGGAGCIITPSIKFNGMSRTYDNPTIYNNCKRYRFDLKGAFNNVILGENAMVSIENVYIPNIYFDVQDTQKIVRILGVSDQIFDSERGMNNDPIIYYINTDNILMENTSLKKSFRVPRHFLSKGYIEFELSVDLPSTATGDLALSDNNFMATITVYEEDYEPSIDMTLAPEYHSQKNTFKPFLNYNNT